MAIHIIKTGMQLSVQDRGRLGYRRYGVPVGGCMDTYSAQMANVLCGNVLDAAVLEIVMHGGKLCSDSTHLISFTGAGAEVFINNNIVPFYRPIMITPGAVIEFKFSANGCRIYMAIAGGVDTPELMGSKSFSTLLDMQVLTQGSILYTGAQSDLAVKMMQQAGSIASWGFIQPASENDDIRFIQGPEYALLTDASRQLLAQEFFDVTIHSNRMGYRLKGPTLETKEPVQLISTAVMPGTIQLTPEGNPLLLMADAQTTGGYPRIAQIIDADVSKCAQKRPGDKIRFKEVSMDTAIAEYKKMNRFISDLQKTIRLNFS